MGRKINPKNIELAVINMQIANYDILNNSHSNYHVIPALSHIICGKIDLNRINFYKLSNIDKLVHRVFGIEECPFSNKRSNFQTEKDIVKINMLTESQKEILRNIYQCDFDMLEERKDQIIC